MADSDQSQQVAALGQVGQASGNNLAGASTAQNSPTSTPPPKTYSQAELNEAIDRDRIEGFMIFARSLPPHTNGLVYGTGNQTRSIMRALEKLGY